jgi:hypothetical protein
MTLPHRLDVNSVLSNIEDIWAKSARLKGQEHAIQICALQAKTQLPKSEFARLDALIAVLEGGATPFVGSSSLNLSIRKPLDLADPESALRQHSVLRDSDFSSQRVRFIDSLMGMGEVQSQSQSRPCT